MERWVQGCAVQMVPFWALRFINNPFFKLKVDLDIGRVFCKMLNFRQIYLFYVWPCATWDPRKYSASALNGPPG